jgi:glycosyltransferase involved in cell wall biosynthesis
VVLFYETDRPDRFDTIMSSAPPITVIMATAAEPSRMLLLDRAIRSVTCDQSMPGIPAVVVNGNRHNDDTIAALRRRNDIRLFLEPHCGFSAALRCGRERVDTPFFCFLDDDDLYFPGALQERFQTMVSQPHIDVLVTEGLKEIDGELHPFPILAHFDQEDLFQSLMRSNWLASCGGFFRTDSVESHFFDPNIHHLEWTYLAFLLLKHKRVVHVRSSSPHFLISDSAGSGSKSTAYLLGSLPVLLKILEHDLSPAHRRLLKQKICNCLHNISDFHMRHGHLGPAWRAHIQSLLTTSGYKYLLYSRWLILATLRASIEKSKLSNRTPH